EIHAASVDAPGDSEMSTAAWRDDNRAGSGVVTARMADPAWFAAFITGGANAAVFTALQHRIWRLTVSEALRRSLKLIERFSSARTESFKLCLPRLGPARWRGCNRILRPRMFGVAAAQLGADGRVAAAPKSGQVARGLHRPLRRRQQFDRE